MNEDISLAKAFSATTIIKAHEQREDGSWIFHAPVALTDVPDYDGQILTKAGILKGLATHERLGGHIDYAHMYRKTKDLDYIIGKRVDAPMIDGVPHIVAKLIKSKPLAQKIWGHLNDPDAGPLGVSIEGIAKATDPSNRHRVTETEIHLITIDPAPKGYEGTRIRTGAPSDMNTILKSLNASLERDDLTGWVPVDKEGILMLQGEFDPYDYSPLAMLKAITTGSGASGPASTGGAALRRESLDQQGKDGKKPPANQRRCGDCKAWNHEKRKKCRRCQNALEID